MTLESSKNLGGIGAILMVIGFLGFFGSAFAGVLDLIGIILVLIALKGLADHYNEQGIFNNALYGFIISIVGGVAFVGALVASFIMFVASTDFDYTDPTAWQERFMNLTDLWNFIGAVIVALIVLFIFAVIAAIFYRKSLSLTAGKTGVGMFGTAGMLILIGAVLTIILVGFILIWIAMILLAVAFFSIRAETAQPPPAPPPPPQQTA